MDLSDRASRKTEKSEQLIFFLAHAEMRSGDTGGAVGKRELPAEVVRLLDVQRRVILLYRVLGMDEADRLLNSALTLYPGPWREAALAHYVRLPRTTVRRRIDGYILAGVAERSADGVALTQDGVEISVMIASEVFAAATGAQAGLSDALLSRIARAIRNRDDNLAEQWLAQARELAATETFAKLRD